MEPKAILVATPEPIFRELEASLSSTTLRLVHSSSLDQAMALCAQGSWACVLISLVLPDGSGFELLQQLRQQGTQLPIVMLGESQADLIVTSLRLGATDYISLPIGANELHMVLTRVICERSALSREHFTRQEVSAMLHEISNPLTHIIGLSEMLLEDLPSEHPAHKSASDIRAAAWRLQDIIRRFRTSSAAKAPQDVLIS
jgi:DNA-binding NtrC family response regulator